MSSFKEKLAYQLKHNSKIQFIYKLCFNSLFKFLGMFVKTDETLILINNYGGLKYGDSPKVLFEYIRNHHCYDKYHVVWAFNDIEKYKYIEGCSFVKQDSLAYFLTALKAKYWITNVNIERGLHFKKRKTVYLNTWHGMPFKKIGNSVKGRSDYNCTNIDLWCAEGDFSANVYKRDFNVRPDAILKCGLPRNDRLYSTSENQAEELKKMMGIPLDKKVISYIPTWRESTDGGRHYNFTLHISIEKWEEKLSKDYVLLFRAHHFTTQLSNLKTDNFVMDFSDYPDINDIFIVSDIMISDYSASIADYSILEKPVISFGYDYDDYEGDRGFYLDLEEVMPNGVMRSEDEVLDHILTMDYDEECKKTKEMIKDRFMLYGGKATETCVKALLGC